MSEQERQFRMQKLTEDSIQLQGDVLIITKEKERIQFEKDEYERRLIAYERLDEEHKKLT